MFIRPLSFLNALYPPCSNADVCAQTYIQTARSLLEGGQASPAENTLLRFVRLLHCHTHDPCQHGFRMRVGTVFRLHHRRDIFASVSARIMHVHMKSNPCYEQIFNWRMCREALSMAQAQDGDAEKQAWTMRRAFDRILSEH